MIQRCKGRSSVVRWTSYSGGCVPLTSLRSMRRMIRCVAGSFNMLRSWVATRFRRSGADAGWSRKVSLDLPVSGAHLQRLLMKVQQLVPPDDPVAAFQETVGLFGVWNFFLR